MNQNILPLALTAPLLLFGVLQGFNNLSQKPAFNETLQVQTATGGARPLAVSSMYAESEYLFQVATGYQGINAVEVIRSDGEAIPDASLVLDRMQTSRDALLRGLQLAPGDVSSWMSLARAEEALGNRTGAVDAIQITASLASDNVDAARQRIVAFVTYASTEGPEWVLDHPDLKQALVDDLVILRRYGRQTLNFIDVLPEGSNALAWLEKQSQG